MTKQRIFAIGDLHLDHTGEKSMEVFGPAWANYEERIFSQWKEKITDHDLVLIPGDISWALKLEEAEPDLRRIDALPGTKLLLRGNHDYWWQSRAKIESLALKKTHILQNDCFEWNYAVIYGTRGWISKGSTDFTEIDEKIYERELQRLALSFKTLSDRPLRIVMTHYPPYNYRVEPNAFLEMMKENQAHICVYGHLHGYGHAQIREGCVGGIQLVCVSADYRGFSPQLIAEDSNENCNC
ncbi:MAG: serine/threonine protein phosphatase [Tissierellia bacterium]|nr:serine/threonine protein phosphatase [Tissierellia bacterium]